MCGSSLGGGADEAAEADSTEQSRVRKNTTSTESSAPVVDQVRQDVESAREALDSRRKLDEAEAQQEPELEDFDEDADDDSFEDPLGEFIEEVDFDDESDDDDEYDDLLEDDDDDDEDFSPPTREETPVKPLVRVESGGGKRAGGLSFGGDKGLKRKDQPAEKKDDFEEKQAAKPKASEPHPVNELNGHDRDSDLAADKVVAREKEENDTPKEKKVPAPQPQKAESPVKHTAPVQSGRLCGWLVSYASDSNGTAIELREGKFFVSGSKLKESDLVIEDQSVSTPHAILSLDSKTFMIQDLMSDQGVFVKAKGDSSYNKEEEKVSVAHGDWVRFGNVEYLVTLIANVGE